jgi:hypothetical protein
MFQDDPFARARKERDRDLLFKLGAMILVPAAVYGGYRLLHKPDYSERLDAYREEFGALTKSALTASDKRSDLSVGDRKVLFVNFESPNQELAEQVTVARAKKASEVGLVITADTVEDRTNSVRYNNGSTGYGGRSTFRAIAWPEKVIVGELSLTCAPESFRYTFGNDHSDSHCFYSSEDLAAFVDDVRAGRRPRFHSKDPETDAMFARNVAFEGLRAEMTALDPDKLPRGAAPKDAKVLVTNKESTYELPGERAAKTVEEVGLVIVLRAAEVDGARAAEMIAITRDKKLVATRTVRAKKAGWPSADEIESFLFDLPSLSR